MVKSKPKKFEEIFDGLTTGSIYCALAEIDKAFGVDAAYLFGSYAKGTQREGSDIDIAVISDDFLCNREGMSTVAHKYDSRIHLTVRTSGEFFGIKSGVEKQIVKTGIPILRGRTTRLRLMLNDFGLKKSAGKGSGRFEGVATCQNQS
jgi:predicted nucleotidyltransferase